MISDLCFVLQIGLVIQYWTKYNVASLVLSLILFFVITKITQSPLVFESDPLDLPFVGTTLLNRLILSYFQPSPTV